MRLLRPLSYLQHLCLLSISLIILSESASAQSANAPLPGARGHSTQRYNANSEQVLIQNRIGQSEEGIATQIDKGSSLESGRRWGEAIAHYERALREHPDSPRLLARMNEAKLRYSFDKRYRDQSFKNSVLSLNGRKSAQLYAEILLKVNAHYVSTPHWDDLVENGTRSLEIALGEEAFQRAYLRNANAASLDRFQRQVRAIAQASSVRTRHHARQRVEQVAALGRQNLGIPESAIVFEYIAGATNGLDDYSAYLSADQLKEVYSQIDGNFVGLGVELKEDNHALLIVHVIPGSPALAAGVREGDRIVAVDSRPTANLATDAAASMLQGPEGSTVTLTVERAGAGTLELVVQRRHVEVPSVEKVSIVDRDYGIGYARLPSFQKSTTQDLDAALWQLHRQGMRSLILDLRGNPGGLLTASVEVADKFIQQGGIVETRGRSPHEDYNYQAHKAGTWRVPLVVLIDGDSASASEIFAGAIRDHGRGVVIGQLSYGKGSVQGIFPLGIAGAGLRLTTAKFYSPSGRAISKVGVKPHIVVQHAAKAASGRDVNKDSQDETLRRAVEEAKNRMGMASR